MIIHLEKIKVRFKGPECKASIEGGLLAACISGSDRLLSLSRDFLPKWQHKMAAKWQQDPYGSVYIIIFMRTVLRVEKPSDFDCTASV